MERGVAVSNNNVSGEKLLNDFANSFTYKLKDQYGYTHEVEASLDHFDTTPGTVDYRLATETKTNQPVEITVTATDEESGVGSVSLALGQTNVALELQTDGSYKGVIENSGSYVLTMIDRAGNIAQKSFVVSHVDRTAPTLVGYTFDRPERTSQTVTAKLQYSETNVTLTKAEVSSGLAPDDYMVDYQNSSIRFYENGSVSVWFVDEYGNEGSGLVTVGHIYKNPPALDAWVKGASNDLSADVYFVMAKDENNVPIDKERELTDLNVRYSGIVKNEVVEVENELGEKMKAIGPFTFTENATYTFEVFDNEGISSHVTVKISDIDKLAPKITQIRWSYDYEVLENGTWVPKTATGQQMVGDEAGYKINPDQWNVTKQDVDVTVVTDSDTTIMGKPDSVAGTEHTLSYAENGMYIFNTQKANGTYDSYGVQVGVIDKEPPVIDLAAPELVFYENPLAAQGTPYSKDLIAKPGLAFNAYDMFGGKKDLADRIEIDYGTFQPDDISQNRFDRTRPYTIIYRVSDDAHNETEARLTVRLVGLNDSIALVNDRFPDYAGRLELIGEDSIRVKLGNFAGISYARVEKGVKTLGQMKKAETVLLETVPGSGEYEYTPTENGWYTMLVQTDKRDYFNLQIYFDK